MGRLISTHRISVIVDSRPLGYEEAVPDYEGLLKSVDFRGRAPSQQESTPTAIAIDLAYELVRRLSGGPCVDSFARDEERHPKMLTAYEPPLFSKFEEFLTSEEFSALVQYTLAREHLFQKSQVISPTSNEGRTDVSTRRSKVLFDLEDFRHLIADRLHFYFDRILDSLQHPRFSLGNVEAQITASNDEEFFKTHNDNTHPALVTRELTYVLFFHREPKAFSGGELRLYESRMENGHYVGGPRFVSIAPQPNTVVFFPSYLMHEVTMVRCPTRNFTDSRFTLNGWMHRRSRD